MPVTARPILSFCSRLQGCGQESCLDANAVFLHTHLFDAGDGQWSVVRPSQPLLFYAVSPGTMILGVGRTGWQGFASSMPTSDNYNLLRFPILKILS